MHVGVYVGVCFILLIVILMLLFAICYAEPDVEAVDEKQRAVLANGIGLAA